MDQDGFDVIEGFLTPEETDQLKFEAAGLIKGMPEESNRTVFSTLDSENQQVPTLFFKFISLFTYLLSTYLFLHYYAYCRIKTRIS